MTLSWGEIADVEADADDPREMEGLFRTGRCETLNKKKK